MADPIGNFVPDYIKEMKDEDVRQVILELGTKITDRAKIKLGLQKLTKEDPEYWGLNCLVPTDDMARLCLLMGGKKIRIPMQFEEICALVKNNSDKFEKTDDAYVQEMLDTLSYNGVIEWNYENPQHAKQWVLPMYVPGSAEFANMNMKLLEEHPEMGRFFERMSRLPLEGLTHMVPEGGAGIGMHVIPVEKAIEMENNSVSVEHISHWLDKYEGKYAASPCSCRRSRRTYEEGCADDPEGWCVAVGDMADYVVETDKGGHYITKEQALEIFRQAEDNGFVHQITNIDGEDKIFAICNCNVNVCYALRTSQLFNTPNMSRSAYRAHVKTENCVACGRCVERS
ncbi:MAG: pyridine nucleotide-disulfide oxidoreductase, partial [Agathobacter sp.]|nr:pyridine nucleotide-disulfide oxidoreductase [Agathobacter sp.]